MKIKYNSSEHTIQYPIIINFYKNPKLIKYLNKHYDGYVFYPMSSPVTYNVKGNRIQRISKEMDYKIPFDAYDANMGNKLLERAFILEGIIIPVIDEIISVTTKKEIYLYYIHTRIVEVSDLHGRNMIRFRFEGVF